MVAGGVAFLPWLPIFLYQAAHTGTPWARPAGFGALVSVVEEFAGGGDERARILALVLFGLAALGLLGRAIDARYVVLDLRTQPRARGLAAVVVGTPTLAIAAGMLSHTAFVARYTSVVFPAFCVLAGMGVTALASRRARTVVLAVAAALGLAIGIGGIFVARTQAGEFAAALKAHARPGDVVAFCPDQLGPAVTRLLPKGLQGVTQLTYPRGTSPAGIDWVDYGDAVRAAPVDQFAESLDARAGPAHSVWVVWGRGYRPYHTRCTALVDDLARRRGSEQLVVRSRPIHYFEHGTLLRFGG
jgi:hypothetical protein